MPDISTAQWVFGGLIAVGLLIAVAPGLVAKVRSWLPSMPDLPDFSPDPADELMDRFQGLSELQNALEARGHVKQAEEAGTWYALLRAPVEEPEP